MSLTKASYSMITGAPVNVMDYGAKCDGVTDDTIAVQTAMTYCNANSVGLVVPGICLLTSSININRAVDALSSNTYLQISSTSGGGFTSNLAISLFSTTLASAQAIEFSGITFSAGSSATATYVLSANKFIRTKFVDCNFIYIKLLNSSASVVQSIYLFNNNVRRFTGTFFTSTGTTADCKFIGNIVEAGESFANLNFPVGCTFQANLIEGMSGTALKYGGAQGLSIVGNYFEANGQDIDGASLSGSGRSYGVALIGNSFSEYATNYAVLWGDTQNCVSMSNYCNTKLHSLLSTSNVYIDDVALVSLTSIVGYQVAAQPTLAIGTSSTVLPVAMVGGAAARFSGNVMEVTTAPTWGSFAVGQLITSANVATGTRIVSFGSGSGGTGTYNLDFTVGSIPTAQPVTSPYDGTIYNKSNATLAMIDGVVNGDNYGGGVRGYSIVGAGGYLGLGPINGGAYTEAVTIDYGGSVAVGGLLATNASTGHFSIPTTSGTPGGGAPLFKTGTVPLQFDTANNKLWVYNGGWKSITLT